MQVLLPWEDTITFEEVFAFDNISSVRQSRSSNGVSIELCICQLNLEVPIGIIKSGSVEKNRIMTV